MIDCIVGFNFDFTHLVDDGRIYKRGTLTYHRPYGWCRVALKVKNRYGDSDWLGGIGGGSRTGSISKEWPVSYHGTKEKFVKDIASKGYDLSKGKRFLYGKGIYSTPDPCVAEKYAAVYEFKGQKYKVLIQNR